MGKYLVVILASVFAMGILLVLFPGLYEVAFQMGGYGVKWGVLVGLGVVYTFNRLVSKK